MKASKKLLVALTGIFFLTSCASNKVTTETTQQSRPLITSEDTTKQELSSTDNEKLYVSNKDTIITINKSTVPTVFKVVGEKEIIYTSTKNSSVNGKNTERKEVTYQEGSLSQKELLDYFKYLVKQEKFKYIIKPTESDRGLTIEVSKEIAKSKERFTIDVTQANVGPTIINYSISPVD